VEHISRLRTLRPEAQRLSRPPGFDALNAISQFFSPVEAKKKIAAKRWTHQERILLFGYSPQARNGGSTGQLPLSEIPSHRNISIMAPSLEAIR
jgi:hypothetical protein